MDCYSLNSCKFVCNWHSKLLAFTGRNTCSLQAKVPAIEVKNTPNCRKNTRNLNSRQKFSFMLAKPLTIAVETAITTQVKSPENCRLLSVRLACQTINNFRALSRAWWVDLHESYQRTLLRFGL